MTGAFEQLTWDSEFFGIPIGRAHLDGADAEGLERIDREAAAAGIECLYATVDPNDLELNCQAQLQGYRLVEVALDLEHPTSILSHRPPTRSVPRLATVDDLDSLSRMIPLLARWSRFASDHRFGPLAAERMHWAWVERAARREGDRALVVAEDETGLTGLATQSQLSTEIPRIDLIASLEPGSGSAQAMVDFSYAYFGERPSRGGPIAARNTASLRFVEQMGLRTVGAEYIYHRWLDESPRGQR